ncbi:MAG: carbamoyltransferase HypF, partial [Acidobacteriota bacterium]|nr:carbamoyltransferase HypF [Acidobacteriota bacterium]
HETLARAIREACRRIRLSSGLEVVALSGGCFQNRLLTERASALLESDGFEVLIHRRVPPNDGGVSLGQAAIAAYRRRTVAGGI